MDSVLIWHPRCSLLLSLLPLSVASIPLPLLSLLPLSQLPLQPFHSLPLPPDLLLQPPQVGVVLQVWHCACFFEEQVLSVDETVVSLDMVGECIAASCNQILVEIFPQAFQAKAGYSRLVSIQTCRYHFNSRACLLTSNMSYWRSILLKHRQCDACSDSHTCWKLMGDSRADQTS